MRATRTIYLGLFCLAGAVLMLEIALTRIMSVLMWGHYAFLVISTALLGFGAAGTWLSIWRKQRNESESRGFLARNCLLFAVTLVISVMICTRLGYEPTQAFQDTRNTVLLPVIYAILAVPFFFAGLAIGFLLSSFAHQVNAIYFSDLLGAGVGALVVTVFLNSIGAPATLVAAGTLALLSRVLFLGSLRRWTGYAWAGVFCAGLVAVAVTDPWGIPVPQTKGLHDHQDEIVDTRWSLLARIDILASSERPPRFGCGSSSAFFDRTLEYRTFFMDGSNPSRMIKAGQDPWFLPVLLSATPYAFDFDRPKVLTIGAGGGIDTMVALHHGAAHVTAVEINPVTVDLVTHDYAEYLGHLFERPNVTLVAAEGRHFLTRDDNQYDIIRLTGVDTRAASAIGANALDHAYLYTTEAVRDFWSHLTPDGIVAVSRASGWQRIRLLSVLLTSLEELGVADPGAHLAIVDNGRWSDVSLRRRPFTRKEIAGFLAWAERAQLEVVYDPFGPPRDNWADRLIRMSPAQREGFYESCDMNLRPVTDDSPFFFETKYLGTVLGEIFGSDRPAKRKGGLPFRKRLGSGYTTLLLALGQAIVLSVLFILAPLVRLRSESGSAARRGWSLTYFCLLGLGFILAELVFVQKYMIFLGGPTYSLSVTLFAILVFSGLGAYTAKRINITSRMALGGVLLTVVVLVVVQNLFLSWGLPHLLGFSFPMRIVLGIASLAAVSFVMGMPFPMGIRILDRTAPSLIAWAWGGNACLTVIGSVLSVIISMSWGFFIALAAAAGCYVLAGICATRMAVTEPSPVAST